MHYLIDSVHSIYAEFDNCKCDVTLYYIVTVNYIIKYTKKNHKIKNITVIVNKNTS